MRFRPQPPRGRGDFDDYADGSHPARNRDITVYDSEPTWVPIGLLDAKGCPIRRYVGPTPIGFLWDRSPSPAESPDCDD